MIAVRFLKLSRTEKMIVLKAGLTLGRIRLMVSLMPYARWRHLLQPVVGLRFPDQREASRLAISVERASRFVPASTCLVKAIALRALLNDGGLNSTLRLGVGPDQGRTFEAHAWLETPDCILIGEGLPNGMAEMPQTTAK